MNDKKPGLTNKLPLISEVTNVTSNIDSISKAAVALPEALSNTAAAIPNALAEIAKVPGKLVLGLVSGFGFSKEQTEKPAAQTLKEIQVPSPPASKPETAERAEKAGQIVDIKLDDLVPNLAQPRKYFDEAALNGLAESIAREGVLEPILVRQLRSGKFEIIAGERRYRAARKVKLSTIPAIIRNVDDAAAFELSVVENIQRENLRPVEEAEAYKVLIDKYKCTQQEIAAKVGKSQSHVANMLRILTLPQSVLEQVQTGALSTGHAKALVGQGNAESLASEILEHKLNVRESEELSRADRDSDSQQQTETRSNNHHHVVEDKRITAMEELLYTKLKLKSRIDQTKLTIWYDSIEELETLIARISRDL